MQVFKCALKITFRNPMFLLIYTVALSFMGVAMAHGVVDGQGDSYDVVENVQTSYAVIDRDGSAEAQGIARYLETVGTPVELADTETSLQDAVATGRVDYMLIVPAGWGSAFAQAAADGEELPKMESVYSFYSAEGALMDADVANFAGVLAACVAADPGDPAVQQVDRALDVASSRATARFAPSVEEQTAPGFTFFLQFSIYSLLASVVVCVSMLLSKLNRTDVRRRNLTSPVSYASYTLQTMLACFVLMLVIDAWIFCLGMACFGESVVQLGAQRVALMGATVVVFSLVPLGLGILLGQLGVGGTAANGAGNITALVLSFLGGAWVPLSIVPGAVQMVARFLPGIWYSEALVAADFSQVLSCWAVLLLFAAALFAVALTVGKLRTQTAEAGGNAAAEVVL